jgi:hypothetical protein
VTYKRLVAAAVLTFSTFYGQSSGDSIEIGGRRLKLGMPRGHVVSNLSPSFFISAWKGRGSECTPDINSCVLWEKQEQPPFSPVANLGFKDGVLNSVIKYWDPEDQQQAVPFARSVYGAIASLVKDGKTTCNISAQQGDSPGLEQKSVYLICGGRSIDIEITNHKKYGESATISESLIK